MSIYIKTSKGASTFATSDFRKLKANNDWKSYTDNGWTLKYVEVYKHIHYVTGSVTETHSSNSVSNALVIAGNPVIPIVDTTLPMTLYVGNTPVGYGSVKFSGNGGVYLNATGYGAAHSYVFYGYLICK